MTHGPLLGKILLFAIPLMLSSMLQLLFNAADIIVVGRFASDNSVAAVGSTGALINLLVSMFMGLSVGVNVMVAHFYAIGQAKDVSETVHTAVFAALAGGVFLVFAGVFLADPLLGLMGSPEEVRRLSALYLRIYFLGMPVTLLYNMGSAVLRAVGDTRRPLYYLTIAGVVNVLLNLMFVIVFRMDVAGVALATILSQALSAFLVIRCLGNTTESYRFSFGQLKATPKKLKRILQLGVPAGIQSSVFSFSNVLIQSSINTFGAVVIAGNAAAGNIDGFIYVSMNALFQACVTFVSANFGMHDFDRIRKVMLECMCIVTVVGLVLGNGAYLAGRQLLSIYVSDPAAIEAGIIRMGLTSALYFLCGMMEVACGGMRGLGRSVLPMVVSIIGACGLRIVWILTIFRTNHTLQVLFLSYPVSWLLTMIVHMICYFFTVRKLKKQYA